MHYVGCDVAKLKLDFSMLPDKSNAQMMSECIRSQVKTKVAKNDATGIQEWLHWLTKNGVTDFTQVHVAMEATGVYHEVAANELVKHGIKVSICNPAQTKKFGQGMGIRIKNDTVDSFVLAYYCMYKQPRAWTPPSPEAHTLKTLIARVDALTRDLAREKNRAEKATVVNAPETIQTSIREQITFLTDQLAKLQQIIQAHINEHEKLKRDLNLLLSIPSIGKRVGSAMLALLHSHSFLTPEQVVSYLGLAPVERQSGTSLISQSRISRHGPVRIRSLLYMASLSAIRSNPLARDFFQKLKGKGKPPKAALCAVMRKLTHLCFGVLKSQKPFSETFHADKGGATAIA